MPIKHPAGKITFPKLPEAQAHWMPLSQAPQDWNFKQPALSWGLVAAKLASVGVAEWALGRCSWWESWTERAREGWQSFWRIAAFCLLPVSHPFHNVACPFSFFGYVYTIKLPMSGVSSRTGQMLSEYLLEQPWAIFAPEAHQGLVWDDASHPNGSTNSMIRIMEFQRLFLTFLY